MSETWLTSDTHLGHGLVARLRGFEDSDSHDRAVASKWDKRVRAVDEVCGGKVTAWPEGTPETPVKAPRTDEGDETDADPDSGPQNAVQRIHDEGEN